MTAGKHHVGVRQLVYEVDLTFRSEVHRPRVSRNLVSSLLRHHILELWRSGGSRTAHWADGIKRKLDLIFRPQDVPEEAGKVHVARRGLQRIRLFAVLSTVGNSIHKLLATCLTIFHVFQAFQNALEAVCLERPLVRLQLAFS